MRSTTPHIEVVVTEFICADEDSAEMTCGPLQAMGNCRKRAQELAQFALTPAPDAWQQ
ncbi:MAG: hypothetical protein ACSLFI_11120 [Solirubrobacterales bacterium]